jgi:hypothetical protein
LPRISNTGSVDVIGTSQSWTPPEISMKKTLLGVVPGAGFCSGSTMRNDCALPTPTLP